MAKITVYKVKLYNVATDESVISKRMATPAGAKKMGGEIVVGTAVDIDASQLEPGEEWTPRNFNPNPRSGFQTQVTT